MTEYDNESASLSDDLPPVQPPSAGFIVQLFVFPALIVMGVVAIWWMFGLIAVGEQDWHKLLQDMQSQNLHIRNRAIFGLANVLDQDGRMGEQGQRLRENREIAQALSDQLAIELRKNSSSKDSIAFQEYLTRALGMMNSFDAVYPVLLMAMEPQRDLEIRKLAVASLSMVVGRANDRGEPLNADETIHALIQLSGDPLPVLRQSSAFALGLFDSGDATHQLVVLLEDGDLMTRVNAAIGLARRGSTEGFTVLRDSMKLPDLSPVPTEPDARDARLIVDSEQFVVVKNVLKAVTELATKFSDSQRQELIPLAKALSSQHPEIRIRIDAESALINLKK